MVLDKTLESPLYCKDSILKEISPGCQLEGLMLKLKLQYFGHLMGKTDLMEKNLMPGKIEGRRRGRQRMRWLGVITDLMAMSLSKLRELVPFTIREGACGLRKWCKLLVLKFDWSSA